jgi:uncharacterized protein with GYD domain
MPKFLYTGQYSAEGLEGSLEEGFAAREAYVRQTLESMGATVEGFYWSYGKNDVVLIVDAPAPVALSFAMVVSSQDDSVQLETTPLLTAADLDEARALLPSYRSPGD